jgi:hypothetical protein
MADPTPGASGELLPGVLGQQNSRTSQISSPDVFAPDEELAALARSEIEEAEVLESGPAADSEASAASKMAPFDGPFRAATTAAERVANRARAATADSAETPISPPAPPPPSTKSPSVAYGGLTNPSTPATDKPREKPVGPAAPPTAPDQPNEAPRGQQGAALNAASMVAAALTGGLRRPEPLVAASAGADSKDTRTAAPSVLDRLAVKSVLDNLRRSPAQGSVSQAASATGGTASAPPPLGGGEPNGAFPAGGLRDKLSIFTADRMQTRRDAEQVRGAMQSGTAVLASLGTLERRETAGILNKIRDVAKVNGGIENVLSEMRPGGAFEDLRRNSTSPFLTTRGLQRLTIRPRAPSQATQRRALA